MEIKASILAVEKAYDGVVFVLQQEKIKIPLAEEPMDCDEAKVVKKMVSSMKMMGLPIDLHPLDRASGFRTGLWVTMEDYEEMGKPTIGDVLKFGVSVEK